MTRAPSRSFRPVLAATLGIIAVIAVLASILGTWARSSVYDSDAVARAVDNAMRDPEVIDALATYLTDQVMTAAEVEARIERRLESSRLDSSQAMVGQLLAAGARSQIQQGMVWALSQDTTRRAVVTAARQSHAQMVRILDTGDIGTFTRVGDGTVTLNLLPLMGRGLEIVRQTGLLPGVTLPTLESGGDSSSQIAELEAALGTELPADFGQLVVYEGGAVNRAEALVAQVQQTIAMFERSLLVVQAIAVGSCMGAVLLARRRLRALGYLSVGMVMAMAAGRAVIRAALSAAPTVATNPGARASIAQIVNTLAAGLITAVTITLLLALLTAAITLYADRQGSLVLTLRHHRELVTVAGAGLVVAVLWLTGATAAGLTVTVFFALALIAAAWLPAQEVHR